MPSLQVVDSDSKKSASDTNKALPAKETWDLLGTNGPSSIPSIEARSASAPAHAARSNARTTSTRTETRTIRIGILGLGHVGQAVARLAPSSERLRESGVRCHVVAALVRDIERVRRCPKPARLTTNPAAFLRGAYDVVVEALGTIEPARSMVARLLGRGIPVVSANKALIAAHGAELSALASRRATTLRYEASALAGVPFLGALASRPLVSDVRRFAAVVNGTSNFILSTLDAERGSFDDALKAAERLGLTEPDPSRDLDGLDAADKVTLLASLFGWRTETGEHLDVQGIRDVTAADLAAARAFGGTIKPIAWASRTGPTLEAFIGPALVPERHPLAALGGTLSGIQLSGRYVDDLFFSGPGAGPDVTAATILDDVMEAVASVPRFARRTSRPQPPVRIVSPATEWLVRATFPGLVPEPDAARNVFAAAGLTASEVSDPSGNCRWLRVDVTTRARIDAALAILRDRHRLRCAAWRALRT